LKKIKENHNIVGFTEIFGNMFSSLDMDCRKMLFKRSNNHKILLAVVSKCSRLRLKMAFKFKFLITQTKLTFRRHYGSRLWDTLDHQTTGLDSPSRWYAFVDRVKNALDPEEVYNTRDGQTLKAYGHYDLPAKPLHDSATFPFTRELEVS
jgi:hypothetical protein